MSERETRDLMTVDTFSQLPFIRSSTMNKPEKSCSNSSGIRLFGIDFTHDSPDHTLEPDSSSSSTSSSKDNNNKGNNNSANKDNNNGSSTTIANTATNSPSPLGAETNRKFECHYCCRNFPTSQALGGHQNAHKRERQHAKRAHLQSAMAAAHHQSLADGAHVYGLVNYHRLGSLQNPSRFGLGQALDPLHSVYPSWSPTGPGNFPSPRFYAGGIGPPSPAAGTSLWRMPPTLSMPSPVQRDATMPLPLFAGDRPPDSRLLFGSGGAGSLSNSAHSPPLPHENIATYGATAAAAAAAAASRGASDQHLSLDLHL